MSLTARIRSYVERVEDIPYLTEVLSQSPLDDLYEALCQMLQSPSRDDVASADLFIRDVVSRLRPDNSPFLDGLPRSGIPDNYRRNLFARNYWIRRTTVSTCTVFSEWLPANALSKAFEWYALTDPILLPALVRTQMERTQWEDWSWPELLLANPEFLVRWSVLELLEGVVRFPLPQPRILLPGVACLSRLQADPHPLVKREADYHRIKLDYFEVMPSLPKAEKRRRSKEIDKVAPRIEFSGLGNHFANELFLPQKTDFNIADLHDFVERCSTS